MAHDNVKLFQEQQTDTAWKYVDLKMSPAQIFHISKAIHEGNSEENFYKDIEPILPVDDFDRLIDDIDWCLYEQRIHCYLNGFSEFVYF